MIKTPTPSFVNTSIGVLAKQSTATRLAPQLKLPHINIAPSSKRLQFPLDLKPLGNQASSMLLAPTQKLNKGSVISQLDALMGKNSATVQADFSYLSQRQKEKHLNSTLYAQLTYLDDDGINELSELKQKDEKAAIKWLQDKFPPPKGLENLKLTDDDAKTMLKMLDTRLNTSEELNKQFPNLSPKQAEKMLDLTKKLDINLHQDHISGELVFVARGTQDKGDLIQDVVTGLGGMGHKYRGLEKLVDLMNEGSSSPEQLPKQIIGHSLGGGMALAAAKGLKDDNGMETMILDTQKLNHKQKKAFEQPTSNEINETNYSVNSNASLDKLMAVPLMFEQPNTVRLDNVDTFLNPVTELTTNHMLPTLRGQMREIPVAA
ncbi:hypothetical protein [Agarilytica rhodophyticola]|uniref:hypothetical protein n=1 Tax=Agarilytica rhodophyticola TaxID=1737490 RepID=UPI000B343B6F|nr:hypothetical protein [Agarilytica rhodophyticola]